MIPPKIPSSANKSLNFLNSLPKAPSSANKSFTFFIKLPSAPSSENKFFIFLNRFAIAPSSENKFLNPFTNPLIAFIKPLKKSAHCFAALYAEAARTPAATSPKVVFPDAFFNNFFAPRSGSSPPPPDVSEPSIFLSVPSMLCKVPSISLVILFCSLAFSSANCLSC